MDAAKQHKDAIAARLPELARQSLSRPAFEIDAWTMDALRGGATSAGVYRLSIDGHDDAGQAHGTLILKITGLPDPMMAGLADWQREIHFYRSDLRLTLPAGLRAPRCYGVDDQADGSVWLWLEDLRDAHGHWSLQNYNRAARALGRFNGAYLSGRRMPQYTWLSQGWLRAQIERSHSAISQLPAHLNHPIVGRMYPPDLANLLFETWANREVYLGALAQLPQTFCHMDAFRRNLFLVERAGGADELAAVDWSYAGAGAVGEELVPLILGSVFFYEVDSGDIALIEDATLTAYGEGLREAGWAVDMRQVRLGYAAAAALRYGLGILWIFIPAVLDDAFRAGLEQAWGRPITVLIDFSVEQSRRFTMRLAREAQSML